MAKRGDRRNSSKHDHHNRRHNVPHYNGNECDYSHISSNHDIFHHHRYCHHHSAASLIVKKAIGFVVFIILLSVAEIVSQQINNPVYAEVINFFSTNISLFFIIFLVGLANDIFWNFYFPFNLVAPVISSVLSVFIVELFYRMWNFIDSFLYTGFSVPINAIYVIVFMLTLLFGYLALLARGARRAREKFWEKEEKIMEEEEKRRSEILERISQRRKSRSENRAEWEKVGSEIRQVFYNIGKTINDAFERHYDKAEKKLRSHGKRRK